MFVGTIGASQLKASYDYRLVSLSVFVGLCASYSALDLARRAASLNDRVRYLWLFGGAGAMGVGIWSLHYIGMLAFRLPVPVSYDWPTAMLSLRAAIFCSAISLFLVGRWGPSVARAVAGGVVMGVGIGFMHYAGMMAMRSTAACQYDLPFIALSVALGICLSSFAFLLTFAPAKAARRVYLRNAEGALLLGLAIAAMHYMGMAAVVFSAGGPAPDLSHAVNLSNLVAGGLAVTIVVVLAMVILASVFDRRLSERSLELESAEERYRQLFERSLAGILRTTSDGRILECNLACARMFGYSSPEELIASPVADRYFDPSDRSEFMAALEEAKRLTSYEQCMRRHDGSEVWLLCSASLVEARDGGTTTEETFIDITERRNAEETFRKAFDANPEPITIATLAEGRYLDVNESFLRITGYSREEVIGHTSLGMNFWERPEDRARFVELIKRQGSLRGFEIRFRTKSGQIRAAMDSAEIIDVAGEKCAIAIFRDVTEQQALERQLRQTQKMEAIGQLTGGIAHDFNNLLGVIIGYSEILGDKLPPSDPLQKECEQIRKAGQSAAALTRQLLAFSRQQVLEPKVLDVNSIVLHVETMLRRLIGEHIILKAHLDPALGTVKADQSQIEQVIVNLAVNARDAMPQGGKLTIETRNVDLDEEYARNHPPQLAGAYIELSVSDTGIGMDAETQARIFEPFFTTKDLGKGTGLGLSTVYGIVRQSGGHIWVYSELGHGTAFKIYLPRIQEPAGARQAPVSPAKALRGSETILLVEDEEALRQLTSSQLLASGYVVLEAKSPDDASLIASRHPGVIDLLLTDMVMPGISGRILAARLSNLRPHLKVLYMSGYTGFSHSGAGDADAPLLSKPFTRETLLRKVREVIQSEQKVGAPVEPA